jgi:hypothetical protein
MVLNYSELRKLVTYLRRTSAMMLMHDYRSMDTGSLLHSHASLSKKVTLLLMALAKMF